jgi:hypothetical protein
MNQASLQERAATSVTRRTIVKTGIRLAYAAPLVAASFKLTTDGALAAICPPGYQGVQLSIGPSCCRCRGSVLVKRSLVVSNGRAQCVAPNVATRDAECVGLIQSIP